MTDELATASRKSAAGEFGFFDILFDRWRIIAAGGLAAAVLAAAYAVFVAEPVYRSAVTAVVRQQSQDGGLGGLQSSIASLGLLPGLRLGGSDKTQEHIAFLSSDRFLRSFAARYDIKNALFSTADNFDEITENDVVLHVRKNVLSVNLNKSTGLINITVEDNDPERAALWANDIVTLANAQLREQDLQDAQLSLKYLREELGKTSITSIQEAISALMEAQVNRAMLANVHKDYAFRILDPAVAADEDDPVKPNKAGITLLGLMLGSIVTSIGLLMLSLLRGLRKRR